MEIHTKYSIGDVVFCPRIQTTNVKEPCPDCCGNRVWEAILGTGEHEHIACPTCSCGYEGARGVVPSYEVTGWVQRLTIGAVRLDTERPEEITYMCHETGVGSGALYDEAALYPTRAAAKAALPTMLEKMRIQMAETTARSLAHKRSDRPGGMLSYFRSMKRKALRDLKRAEEGIAREKAKVAAKEPAAEEKS